jgi:hypothetical protein
MLLVAIRCQDRDFVAARLQSHGCIDDQAFGASDSKVRMHENDALSVRSLRHTETRMQSSVDDVRETRCLADDLFCRGLSSLERANRQLAGSDSGV